MADSKFRAMDKTDADKTGGVRNFCTIYSEVEKDGFIPPWEYYKKIKGIAQDIVDKTIMHIENFTLKLNKIELHIKHYNYPVLSDEEIKAIKVIAESLYSNIVSEGEKSFKLYNELRKEFLKK
jgi:hypothetical protein